MIQTIKIRGARQHNLKNVNLDIPKNKLVVMTGVSGSGKSSLAFDTIYAEGQRRYVESLSAYARQFLGIMDKPDVDLIEGLSPSISIDQKTTSHNPRSTVGTITEIYDYLRLLFARIGHPHCPNCKIEISKLSLDEIVGRIMQQLDNQVIQDKIKPHTFRLFSPVVRSKKGEFKDLFENIRNKGFFNIMIDKKPYNLKSDEINLIKANKHSIDVEVDTFTLTYRDLKNDLYKSNLYSRLTTSVEQGLNLSDGLIVLSGNEERLFSEKFSCPLCGMSLPELEPRMFSFNSPLGACETCKGLGTVYKVDPSLVLNERLTINEGGILPLSKIFYQDTWHVRIFREMCKVEGIDLNTRIGDLSKEKQNIILYGSPHLLKIHGPNRFGKITGIVDKFKGVITEMERRFFENSSEFEDGEINRFMRQEVCKTCNGKKLKNEILSITIDGKNIMDISEFSINKLYDYAETFSKLDLSLYEKEIARMIVREINTRLAFLVNVGLSYLTINRSAQSLSGGELQRIRLASQIGSGLTGVLYVLDEPSIGLHPRDVSALIKSLQKLRDLGNSILLVEHDRETIEKADYAIELGPHAGSEGGRVMFTGSIVEMKKSKKSLTGAYLSNQKDVRFPKRDLEQNRGSIELQGATQFNLKDITVKIPLGNLVAVTGVSGSGKSTLIVETLYPALKYYLDGYYTQKMGDFKRLLGQHYIERIYLVDQSPIGRTPRSNPVTYIGVFDDIRDIFANTIEAKAKGFKKGRFSFNVRGGRCEKCQGAGVIKVQMQFLPDVYITCDVCLGHRYNRETLEIKYKGKTIYEILKMTVDEGVMFFQNHVAIANKLHFLKSVGLGYINLGQPAPTFSGGEAQRIKLAHELSRRDTGKTVYILDEPTTGLHLYDIEKLLATLYQLVERGNTVIIIEHNVDVIKNCQYIIDLGPEGGEKGGNLVYEGQLHGIINVQKSYTGAYLKSHI